FDEPVDHLERGGLAAAGGADEGGDVARRDRQVEPGHRGGALPPVALDDRVEDDVRAGDVAFGCRFRWSHHSPFAIVRRPSRTSSASNTKAMATMRTVPVSAISSALAPPSRDRPLKISDPRPGPST